MAETTLTATEHALENQRIGIVAPILGGWLLKSGVAPLHIFLGACVYAVIAAVATGLLRARSAGGAPLAVSEIAR